MNANIFMIKKTEQFLYFQNKAQHYHNLRKMQSPIAAILRRSGLRGEQSMEAPRSHSNMSDYPRLPQQSYNKSYHRKMEDEMLIDRLITIKPQITNEGYSRYHRPQRKFRDSDPHHTLQHRTLQLQNEAMSLRIRNVSPAIGHNGLWGKEYRKKVQLKRNISRHWGDRLRLSTQSYVPLAMKSFVENGEEGKEAVVIKWSKLMELPQISEKKKTLLFQRKGSN